MRAQTASTRAWKAGPGLAAGRLVVGREDVDAERGVRRAADVAVVALGQIAVDGQGHARRVAQRLGRLERAAGVAGDHVRHAGLPKAARQPRRLRASPGAQRHAGELDHARALASVSACRRR